MKRFLQIVAVMLIIFQLFWLLPACTEVLMEEGGSERITSATVSTEEAGFDLMLKHLSSYVIVIPKESEEIFAVAELLQGTIENKIGKKLPIQTDCEEATEQEILVGQTDRDETRRFYAEEKAYNRGYALVGKRILILGDTSSSLSESVMMFKENLLDIAKENSILLQSGEWMIDGKRTPDEQATTESKTESITESTTENKKEEEVGAMLKGITINALGDSYFAGETLGKEGVWLTLLANKYGIDMNNYGIGGSTVTNYITNKNPMCERYQKMIENQPNIVLVEGGRNDYNNSVPIGAVDGYDTKTFSGALNVIVEGMKEKYPNAMIVCISSWNFPGEKNGMTYRDYADAMEAVAKRQGVYFIPAYDPAISGIDMSDEAFRAQYSIKPTDVSHLNAEGMKIVMAHFEVVLDSYYRDFLSRA